MNATGAMSQSRLAGNQPALFLLGISRCAIIAVLLLLPWIYGGELPITVQAAGIAVGAAALVWLCCLLTVEQPRAELPLAVWPMLLALPLSLATLLTIDTALLQKLAPVTAEFWAIGGTAEGQSAGASISLAPSQTRLIASRLALAVAVAILSANLFVRLRHRKLLLAAMATGGTIVAVAGLYFQFNEYPHDLWKYWPGGQTRNPFALFPNRNHAAAWMNMALGCSLGLLFWKREPGSWGGLLLSLAAVLITGVGVVGTTSRGALVSMAAGFLAIFLLLGLQRHEWRRLPWLLAIIALIGGGITWLNLSAAVRTRAGTILQQNLGNNVRLQHWEKMLEAAPDFLITGSGLGTYGMVASWYSPNEGDGWFKHAENQYLETLIEGGVIGLGLVAVSVLLLLFRIVQRLKSDDHEREFPFTLAAVYIFVSQAVHAFFDFALTIPANTLTLAALLGVACARSGRGMFSQTSLFQEWGRFRHPVTCLTCAVAVIALCWLPYQEAFSLRSANRGRKLLRTSAMTDPDRTEAQLLMVEEFLQARPDDGNLQSRLGLGWLQLYQLRTEKQLAARQELQGASPQEIERLSSPEYLFLRAAGMQARNQWISLTQLRKDPIVSETVAVARQHFVQAVESSPLLLNAQVHRLETSWLDSESTPQSLLPALQALRERAGRRSDVMFRTGRLAFALQLKQEAALAWRTSLETSPDFDSLIIRIAGDELEHEEFLSALLPAAPDRLLDLANEREIPPAFQEKCLALAYEKLQAATVDSPRRQQELARYFTLSGSPLQALQHTKRSVEMDPQDLRTRFDLASQLERAGLQQEALIQAQTLVDLSPGDVRYRKLLERLEQSQVSSPAPEKLQEFLSTTDSAAGESEN